MEEEARRKREEAKRNTENVRKPNRPMFISRKRSKKFGSGPYSTQNQFDQNKNLDDISEK